MPTLDELLAYSPAAPAPTQSGLRRRALLENPFPQQRQLEQQNAAPAVAVDPYANYWIAQTGRSQAMRFASSAPALGVLGAKLVGADEKASEWANNFREMDERATMLGPKVQDFSADNDLAGNVSALGYNLAGLVPDLAMTLTGAGAGAVAGREVAGGLARRATRGMLTDITKDARGEAVARAASVAESAARKAPGATPAMVSDTVRVARAAENEGFDDAISRAARVTGLRTPLDKARADRFEKFGSKAGVIAGQFPSLNRENVESLDKDTTDQGDAFATLLGTTGASALGILPVERFLGRFGAEAKAQVAKKAQDFLPRVAKEAATQGLAEGSTEVFQTAAMRATHQYVGENVNLFDADALNEYLGAFLAGGVLGATVGGGAEATRSVASGVGDFGLGSVKKRIGEWGDMRRAARVEKRKIKAGDEIPLEGAVGKDTVDTFNQHADDLKFDEDLAADAKDSERRTHERYEAFRKADTNPTIDILQRSPSQLPIKFNTPLKQMLMGAINRDSPIWANRAEAKATADALQRLMTGEKLGGDDTLLLVGLSDQMKPGAMSTLFAEADNFASQVKALDADGLWTKSQLQEAEDDTEYTGAMADAFGEARDKMRTTESEALDARLSGATTITDGPAAEDDAVSQDTYGLNEDKPENRPQVRLFNMTRKDPDFEKVKAEVADNVLKRANNWTPSAYAARVNDPGYVGVRGAPNQLLDLGALASYVRGRDGDQADLRVAMLAGLGEAIASGVKIDPNTLTPGEITLKNTNEVFELTPEDISSLKRLQVSKASTFAERLNKTMGVLNADQRAVQMERNARLAQTVGVRGAVLTPQDGSGKRTTDPVKLADRTAAQEYDAAELAAFEFARSKGYDSIADWRRAELTERGKNPVTSTRVHRAVANTIKGFAKNMRAGGRTEAQVYEAAEAAADAAAKKDGFSSIAEQVMAKLTERDQEPVTDAAVQLSVDATIEGFVKGIREKKAEAQTEATSDTRGKRRKDEEDFINTADEAGVALGDVDPRLVARKAPPTTNRGNIRDVRVSDDLADAAQLNEARRPLAALADEIGVDVKSILKIEGDEPTSDTQQTVPATVTLASGGTINADVPPKLLGFNRLLDKKSNTEAPTPKPTIVEEAETEGRAAATDAKVEGAASFDKRRFAGIKKRYGELVGQLDSIRVPAVRARMEKEVADLIVEGRALRAKIAAAENNVRNVERKSFENESTRGSRAAVRPAAPRAQTPFEAGVAIGEKRLELQYPGDLFDSRAHNLALKELRDPKSGKAVEFYERALRGEFGSARVYEQAWDAYEQDNDEIKRERGFEKDAPDIESKAGPTPEPSTDQAAVNARNAKEARRREVIGTAQTDKIWIDELGADVKDDRDSEEIHKRLGRPGFAATHDSPVVHDGRFDWRAHALRGEGAMVFGAGTYLSTADGVHKHYKDKFTAAMRGDTGAGSADDPRNYTPESKTAKDLEGTARKNKFAAADALADAKRKVDYLKSDVKTEHSRADRDYRGELGKLERSLYDAMKAERRAAEALTAAVKESQVASDDAWLATATSLLPGKLEHPIAVEMRDALADSRVLIDKLDAANVKLNAVSSSTTSTSEERRAAAEAADAARLEYNDAGSYLAYLDNEALMASVGAVGTTTVSPTYQVSVDATADEILDYGALLTKQPMTVQTKVEAALSEAGVTDADFGVDGDDDSPVPILDGKAFYDAISRALGGDVAASEMLQKHGIVGHKYAAVGGTKDAFPNYVIYDDTRITTNEIKYDKDRDIADGVVSNAHTSDTKKLSALVSAILDRLGFKTDVAVKTHDKPFAGSVQLKDGKLIIKVGSGLKGAERIEVLTHEIGHHVTHSFIAEAAGIDVADVARMNADQILAALTKADPKLGAALKSDYDKWKAKHPNGARKLDVRVSRAGAARAAGLSERAGGFDTGAAGEYDYSFDEWLADNIGRALNKSTEVQGIVGQFFKKIADSLRKLYDMMFNGKAKEFAPAPSVDAWVKSLFDRNTSAVRQVSGATLPAASAAGAVRAANQIVVGHLNPYVGSSNNYRFVSNEVLAAVDNATAEKLRRMIEAHEQKANKYKGATRDSIVFEIEYMKAKLASMSGAAVTAGTASTAPPSGSAPTKKWTSADFTGLMQFMSTVLPPNARLDLERAFNRPVALAQIRKHFAKDPTVLQFLDDSHVGLEATLAAGYLAWQDGALAAGPKGKQAFMDFGDSVAQLFGVSATGDLVERTLSDIADGTVERMRANHDVYSARKGAAADNGKLQKALNWMVEDGPIKRAMSGFWTGIQSRLEATGIPAFRALNAELLLPRGKVSDDAGMIVDIRKQLHRYNRSINNALKDLTDTERNDAVNTLQQAAGKGDAVYDTQSEKVRAAVDGVRAVMQHLAAAASKVDAFGPNFVPPANYFPVVMDIREEGARSKLEALYRKPKFKLHVFLAAGYDNKADHTPANYEKAITFLLDAAAGDYEATQGGSSSPTSRSLKRRLSRFVYAHGDANDIREFAALQSKDIDEIFARHLGPMTRMIEFRKRFGETYLDDDDNRVHNPRAKLDRLLALAKSQGAKKADLEYAENAVQAALGNYGTDVSPVLSLLSPDLAKRFSGKKTKRTIQIAQAYQNTRLLPLAILSSLVDPIGIAVRTGGDFKSAWIGMRAGMKALFNKDAKQESIDLLERIGAADEFMPALASHAMFDGPENAWAQRVNRFMFRVNGMSSLVQSTRVMAAYAGEAFLLKHADGAREGNKDSIRYLQELNVSPDDIVEDLNKPGSLVHNADTKEALRRFVDEAILRPNSQQAPLWHRDPFMGLVTQYKGFTYAIYDQITKRMGHELRHGNSWVVLAALAYLPIVLMAELMREWIQYGPDGKPNRKDWGAVDYTMHAAARTGLLGPKADVIGGLRGDIEGNRLPGSSQIGPTASQVSNLVDAFRGYRELDKEVESALPASAAWKHWNDNFGAST